MKTVHPPTAALHTALIGLAAWLAGLSPATIHALHLSPTVEQALILAIGLAVSLTNPLKAKEG